MPCIIALSLFSSVVIVTAAYQSLTSANYLYHSRHFTTTQRHLSSNTNVPFFASEVTSNAPLPTGTTAITNRIPLGTVFDSRDYIFTMTSNVRGYEWTNRQTDEMLDDLIEAAALGGISASTIDGISRDYELNQIVIVPLDWDKEKYGLGAKYDVHDGQQRIVTLCLLFAAMRDNLKADKNAAAWEDTIAELNGFLNPPKVRKEDILRVTFRHRDNEIMEKILLGNTVDLQEDYSFLASSKQKGKKTMSVTNVRIYENYFGLLDQLQILTAEQLVQLLDYMLEHVYMLVCEPTSSDVARNLVLGQGKGMNNEAIDDFKGLVCFKYTLNEDDMYRIFDHWDDLMALPDLSEGADGRDTLTAACILRATTVQRARVRKNDTRDAFERWLRRYLMTMASDGSQLQGSDFFENCIKPASLTLGRYRDSSFDPVEFVKCRKSSDGSELARTFAMRCNFLRGLTSSVTVTKDLEMLILDLLLRYTRTKMGSSTDPTTTGGMTLRELDRHLHGVELFALYVAILKPTAKQRYEMCFNFMNLLDKNSDEADTSLSLSLSEEEKQTLIEALNTFEFGANITGKKIAIALLKRLNMHIMSRSGTEQSFQKDAATYVEHVLPMKGTRKNWGEHWPDHNVKNQFVHSLGNLVMVSRKATTKESKAPFREKKEHFESEVWPLTTKISSDYNDWDLMALQSNHDNIIKLVKEIWS